MGLKLALPVGSLEHQTLKLFQQAGLRIKREIRGYSGELPGFQAVSFLRPQEIPKLVESGIFDLGITGRDWIVETRADVEILEDLGYSKSGPGKVKLVLAAPKHFKLVNGIRVATEYRNIAQDYLNSKGIQAQIVYSYGATEGKVAAGIVDAVIDLVETGETLAKAGLEIKDLILESSAVLIGNRESCKLHPDEIAQLRMLLVGAVRAWGKSLLKMNVHHSNLERVIQILPALKKPTISQLHGGEYYAVESVVPKDQLDKLIPKLKSAGAEDILELEIIKMVL